MSLCVYEAIVSSLFNCRLDDSFAVLPSVFSSSHPVVSYPFYFALNLDALTFPSFISLWFNYGRKASSLKAYLSTVPS